MVYSVVLRLLYIILYICSNGFTWSARAEAKSELNAIHYIYFQEEEKQRRALWEENVKRSKQHTVENGLWMNNFTIEMNEFCDMVSFTIEMNKFGDMVSVTQIVPLFCLCCFVA